MISLSVTRRGVLVLICVSFNKTFADSVKLFRLFIIMEKVSPRGPEGVGVMKDEEAKLEEVEDSLTLCGAG